MTPSEWDLPTHNFLSPLNDMDTISLVLDDIIVTLTSDGPLPIPPWVETAPEGDDVVSWASLHFSGELDGNPLTPEGSEAFGLPAGDSYIEMYAFVTLVDAELNLYEVRRSTSADTLGWAVLDAAYCITDFWQLPAYFSEDDL